ncbi:hypothetical protein HJG60_011644 [Phyllostomus discolor]|uniref:Uncharacterized protein n=1 Tax=Phyllostomus discolor TaxID=89673 RepID=A0A833ZW55_9CHIR|nr:hypothetical protein HJG60_011644 [Phyllostomus discolor]
MSTMVSSEPAVQGQARTPRGRCGPGGRAALPSLLRAHLRGPGFTVTPATGGQRHGPTGRPPLPCEAAQHSAHQQLLQGCLSLGLGRPGRACVQALEGQHPRPRCPAPRGWCLLCTQGTGPLSLSTPGTSLSSGPGPQVQGGRESRPGATLLPTRGGGPGRGPAVLWASRHSRQLGPGSGGPCPGAQWSTHGAAVCRGTRESFPFTALL